MDCLKSSGYSFDENPEVSKGLQKLAREQMKERLLRDILADISICKIEGWDYKEYLQELKQTIEQFL